MSLKTNYKNDMFAGNRKYHLTDNHDGTWNIEDVTQYAVTGDVFNGDDINTTNKAVNMHDTKLADMEQGIDSLAKVQDIPLPLDCWSTQAPYKQTAAVSGMKSTDAPIPGIIYPAGMTADQKQMIDKCSDMITNIETFDGYLEVTCGFSRPTINLTIGLKGR